MHPDQTEIWFDDQGFRHVCIPICNEQVKQVPVVQTEDDLELNILEFIEQGVTNHTLTDIDKQFRYMAQTVLQVNPCIIRKT